MIFDGFALAILTATGWIMLYSKLPRHIRRWIVKYSLFTDIAALFATYFLLGGGITALFASAIVDIIISVALHVANHPSDFEWLFDSLKALKELINQAFDQLKNMNSSYKSKKIEEAIPV